MAGRRVPPRQWEIWFAHLREGIAGEQARDHHVVVLSASAVLVATGVAIVAPITTTRRLDPSVVPIEVTQSNLRELSFIECAQLIALSTSPKRFLAYRATVPHDLRGQIALAVGHVLDGVFPPSLGR